MWRDILGLNRGELLRAVDDLKRELQLLGAAEGDGLEALLAEARALRKGMR